ncbi:2,3-bisphosphoglycerate-independent phosphoglycerate mutase [Neofusicoccum parvum]|uniref:2,3-bisphosphoglycerate-independent phosphoglycerate mutase n=2 Tax=Neofusicoccum parvum TaxID=310453 RepID=R1EYX5_BOTPV|nr:putative -bisphosphoglycerate-independent phosphoglycerate mutase protein [Neofusicoccum parvum UCRNP2]GME21990.1 2,3-bisphosphoglycerate-independent phosphoglycerate mutase [Neofusicoccum parvum]GME34301.1 2,3-bisphosphoglycerate-independent phosphoglycerate mutase [Neofusicoccum parvum]
MVAVDQKAVLIVIDGWGVPGPSSPPEGDAILAAETPVMDEFKRPGSEITQGYTEIEASSLAVGLPEGLMGNSEVGHLNIGAGRVVWQDVVRIDQTIKKGELKNVENIQKSFSRAKNGNGRLHFLGLVSDGGVHSHINHLLALLKLAKEEGVPKVFIHFFGDGRDTDPKSGAGHLENLIKQTKEIGLGEVATVVGRYYAMDRDKRWDRVEVALKGLVQGEGEASTDPLATVKARYEQGETDEFLKPIIVGGDESRIKDDDTLFFFNYRSDRVRELTQLLGDFDRSPKPDFPYPKNTQLTNMTQYNPKYTFPVAFPPQKMGNVLAEWLGKQGVKQCHIAETEKYAHVTFFFNGGVEKQFENEQRDMIPSPRVATYDLQPTMSAMGVAEKVCERIQEGTFEFIMNNFAPPDMVGHTGVYEAAIKGVAETDKAIGKIYEQCVKSGYTLFITADHGNAEEMLNEEGKPKTSHTVNKVPFVMANAPKNFSLKKTDGVLGDVAPTVLATMGLSQPEEMTGASLLVKS